MPTDREEVETLLAGMLHAVDTLDWPGIRAAFADPVRVDYTSLFGGQAEELAADELLSRWRGLLPGFDATQHLIGPVALTARTGQGVTAACAVRAYHHVVGAEGRLWMVAGHYVIGLAKYAAGWKIESLTLELAYQEGNLGLPATALARVQAGQVRS